MKKIKVMSIFGTRPEAIKMSPLIKKLEQNEYIESIVVVTAQHRHMLDQVLQIFSIKTDYDLNIMKERQSLSSITTDSLNGLCTIMQKETPDIILVHGDTTTTFSAALSAFYNQIKVGHVEAGLRTYDKYQPFPEEMNRKLTSAIADLNFAPTVTAKQNLLRENINPNSIFVTGNTAIDALATTLDKNHIFSEDSLNKIDFSKKIITMTAHRRENLGEPLENICRAVNRITREYDDVLFIYALHKNPAVSIPVKDILGSNKQVMLLDPLNILDMHNLMNKSYFVLTDSGGLQEEVPSMGKPVLVLRNVTERPEGIQAGTLKLAGVKEDNVYNNIKSLIDNEHLYNKMARAVNPFGDGNASQRIVDLILFHFGFLQDSPSEMHSIY